MFLSIQRTQTWQKKRKMSPFFTYRSSCFALLPAKLPSCFKADSRDAQWHIAHYAPVYRLMMKWNGHQRNGRKRFSAPSGPQNTHIHTLGRNATEKRSTRAILHMKLITVIFSLNPSTLSVNPRRSVPSDRRHAHRDGWRWRWKMASRQSV